MEGAKINYFIKAPTVFILSKSNLYKIIKNCIGEICLENWKKVFYTGFKKSNKMISYYLTKFRTVEDRFLTK